jgi:hypothetical protein
MAPTQLLVAFGMMLAAVAGVSRGYGAPPAPPTTKYCLSMEPRTGSHISMVECRTRDEWAALEINVDEEWRENGVGLVA